MFLTHAASINRRSSKRQIPATSEQLKPSHLSGQASIQFTLQPSAGSWLCRADGIRAAVLVILSLLAGCSPSPGSGVVGNSTRQLAHTLSASEAAQFAARLANEECERRFHRHPFQADPQSAILQDGEYRWGGLDVGAPKGFSALVRFREDGSKPSVEVYFSSDSR